jgi:hypothetical protein
MRLVSQGRRALAANVADRNQKDGGSVRRAH